MGGEEVVRIWGKARRWFLRVMYKLKQDRYGDITYVLRNKKSKSDFLIAVFSGFSPKGAAPRYNYGETLKKSMQCRCFCWMIQAIIKQEAII